jgi:type I restriction enzyme S subunit
MASQHREPPSPQPSPFQGEGAAASPLSPAGRGQGEGRWKPYPAYKDSGVAWLGQVPEDWRIRRLKTTLRSCLNGMWGDEPTGDDNDIVCIRVADYIRGNFRVNISDPTIRSISRLQRNGKIISRGDLLLEKSGGGDLQPVGAVVLYDHDLPAVNSNFIALIKVAPDHDPNYLCYLHNTLYAGRINTRSIKQTTGIQNLDQSSYLDEKVAIPPLREQHAIAAFLDRETAKIDTLIAKKQRLIELLQEKRTALISQAVTRGLDPNVSMKDSGVEWLGEVPIHWEIKRNQWFFLEIDERSEYGDEELLSVSHITGVTTRAEKEVNMFMAESMEGYKKCQPGDLAINTMWAWMGALGISWQHGIVSPSYNVYRLRNNNDFYPQYLDYLYRTPQHIVEINRFSKGVWSSRLRLYPDEFFLMSIPKPPYEEQKQIVEFIENQTQKRGILINKTETAIEKLREYRTALISAAVTGKIDVRPPSPQPSPLQGEGVDAFPN